MQSLQNIGRALIQPYEQSSPLGNVAKAILTVAATMLGLRHAPKTTITALVAITAFYYGRSRSLPNTPTAPSTSVVTPSAPTEKSNAPAAAASAPEAPSIPVTPSPSISSLADVDLLIGKMQNPEFCVDLFPTLAFLYAHKGPLQLLKWDPCIPGHSEYQTKSSSVLQEGSLAEEFHAYNLELCKRFPGSTPTQFCIKSQTSLSHKQSRCLKRGRELETKVIKRLVPELPYMQTVFFLCSILQTNCSLEAFLLRLKKITDPEAEQDLKNPGLIAFIFQIIWLSQHPAGLARIQLLVGKDLFKDVMHPLTRRSWGQSIYVHFLACTTWYKATKQPKYVDLVTQLYTQAEAASKKQALQGSTDQFTLFVLSEIEAFFRESPV